MSRTAPEFSDLPVEGDHEDIDPTQDFDSQNIESEDTEDVTGTGEDTAAEAPAEAPVSDEDAEKAAEEAKIEETLAAFRTAADEAVAQAEDGFLTPEKLNPVVTAYRNVHGGNKGKSKAKDYVQEKMKDALTKGQDAFNEAMAWNVVQDAINTAPVKSASGERAPRTPVDPTQAFADRVAAQRAALQLVEANVPEGVAEDWESKVANIFDEAQRLYDYEALTDTEGVEEPEVSPIARAAVKIANQKRLSVRARSAGTAAGGTSSYGGPRRDIAAHIQNAFAGLESGTFLTINEIVNTRSDEYGDDSPSSGAVSARLFPRTGKKATVDGVEPGTKDGKKGAYKA